MKRLAIPLALFLAVSLWAPLAAQPESPPPTRPAEMADHLPADTFLYARIPSLAATWEGFRTLPLHQAWLDEEVQEFFEASSEGFQKLFSGAGGDTRLLSRILTLPETFPGEVAFAYLEPDDRSGWALSLTGDPKTTEEFAREVVRPLLGAAAFAQGEVETSGGITVTSYHSPHRTVDVAVAGPRLLIASGEGVMARLVRPASASESTLANAPAFRSAIERVGGSNLSFAIHVNVERAIARAIEDGSEEDRRIMTILGITGMRSVTAGLLMAGGRARESVWLDRPGGHEGLFGIFPTVPVDLEIARLAPKNAFAVIAGSLKPGDLYRLAYELSEDAKRGPLEDFRRLDESLARDMGLKALSDLADFLGTEICFYAALPAGGGAFPEVGAAIEVMKPDRLQMSLDALARSLAGATPRTISYKGRELRYLKPDRSGFLPVTPCWCVTDGYLLVSHHPTILKGMIRRLDGKLSSLLDDESYLAARKALPEDAAGAVYLSTERLFRYLYSLALPFISMAGDDLPFDPAALPTADAVAQHLSFALSALTLEEGGLLVRTDSDGYGPTSLGLYGALAALFIESPWKAGREAASRYPACGGNMKTIHEAITAYRTTNGRYPRSLKDCFEPADSWRTWSVRCHEAEDARREAGGRDEELPGTPYWEDFEYVFEGLEVDAPEELLGSTMLMWDSVPRHNGGRVVLLADGEITWMLEATFQARLAEQGR